MSSHSRILEWTAMIRTHLPALSKPQATVLALWELGHGAGALLCLDGGGAVFLALCLRRRGEYRAATVARVVL